MCGLVAIFSKNKTGFMFQDKTIFQQMLIADMFRGMDSTGVFGVKSNGNLDMLKDASPSPYFLGKKESAAQFFDKIVNSYQVVVGHNRKATMGVVDAQNAHPFIEGDICLVHNGTLTNHRKLANTVIDSHAICTHINENGYKSTLKNIEGAYALIWYNAEEKKMYFCRNSERPLYLVETTNKIYLASENKMLDWILDRNNLSKYTIQNVPTDKVFKFDLETRKLECETKPKKAHPPVQQHTNWNTHRRNQVIPFHQSTVSGKIASISSLGSTKASISTYSSGETILWKLTDFDIGEKTIKFMGETQDIYQTDVVVFIPTNKLSAMETDAFVAAPILSGRISSITSKRGQVIIYLSSAKIVDYYLSANNKQITPEQLKHAGSCCYTCGTTVESAAEVADATITTNANGEIMFISCKECSEHVSYNMGYC